MSELIIILLAGGKSSRFTHENQLNNSSLRDKLLSSHGNITLLEHVVKELISIAPLKVITRGEDKFKIYSSILESYENVSICLERHQPIYGPLGGIYSFLTDFPSDKTKIFIPADLPNIRKHDLNRFIHEVKNSNKFELISIIHPNGQTENLIFAIRGQRLLNDLQYLIKKRIYRVSSLFRLVSHKRFINSLFFESGSDAWKGFVDRDINSQRASLIEERKIQIKITEPRIDFGSSPDPSKLYRQFLTQNSYEIKNKDVEFIENQIKLLESEFQVYQERGLFSLALHTLFDMAKYYDNPQIKNRIQNLLLLLDAK